MNNEIEIPNNKEKYIAIDGLKNYKEQVKTFKKWYDSK